VARRDGWSEIQDLRSREYRGLESNQLPETFELGAAYHVIGRVIAKAEEWTRCRVDHFFDKLVTLDETWLPKVMRVSPVRHFESVFEGLIANADPPEALRCVDLTPRSVGGVYRSGQTKRQPDFHGFDFGDTIAEAEKAVDALLSRGMVMTSDVRAWAWPLLWLRYEDSEPREHVLFVDTSGTLHLFTEEGPSWTRG
jgi:hypothetical protein